MLFVIRRASWSDLLCIAIAGHVKRRWFCRDCGSHLMAEWVGKPSVILRVASLDIPSSQQADFEVKAHIWTSHDCAWLPYGDDISDFSESPQ